MITDIPRGVFSDEQTRLINDRLRAISQTVQETVVEGRGGLTRGAPSITFQRPSIVRPGTTPGEEPPPPPPPPPGGEPVSPLNPIISVLNYDASYLLQCSWTIPANTGGTTEWHREARFWVSPVFTEANAESPWIPLGPVFLETDSAPAGPFPKFSDQEGDRYVKLRVRGADGAGNFSEYSESAGFAVVTPMGAPPPPAANVTEIRERVAAGRQQYSFHIVVVPAVDQGTTSGYNAYADEYNDLLGTVFIVRRHLAWIDPSLLQIDTDWWDASDNRDTYFRVVVYPLNADNVEGPGVTTGVLIAHQAGGFSGLIVNPNFESIGAPWPTFPEAGHATVWTFSTADKFNGVQSWWLGGNAANSGKFCATYSISKPTVHPTQHWALTFYYRTPGAGWAGAGAGFICKADEERSNGSYLTTAATHILPAQSVWTKVIVRFQVTHPETTKLNIFLVSTGLIVGDIYIDAFDMRPQTESEHIAEGAIDNVAAFAANIRPVAIVNTLPPLPDAVYFPIGQVVFLTTDNKLYRNVANVWTKEVDGLDLIAHTVTTGAVAAGAIGTTELSTVEILVGAGGGKPPRFKVVGVGPTDIAFIGDSGAGFVGIWTKRIKIADSISATNNYIDANGTSLAIKGGTFELSLNGITTKIKHEMDSDVSYNAGVDISLDSDPDHHMFLGHELLALLSDGNNRARLQCTGGFGLLSLYSNTGAATTSLHGGSGGSPPNLFLNGAGAFIVVDGSTVITGQHPNHGRVANVSSPLGGATVDNECRAKLNDLFSKMIASNNMAP